MKDRQINKDAVAVQGSTFYANVPTHKQVTRFVRVAEVCMFCTTCWDMGMPKYICDRYGFEMGEKCKCTSCDGYKTWKEVQ